MGQVWGYCALIVVGGLAAGLGEWRRSWSSVRTLRAKQQPQAGSGGTSRLLCTSHLSSDVHCFCKLNNFFAFVSVSSSLGKDWGSSIRRSGEVFRCFFLNPSLLYFFCQELGEVETLDKQHVKSAYISVHVGKACRDLCILDAHHLLAGKIQNGFLILSLSWLVNQTVVAVPMHCIGHMSGFRVLFQMCIACLNYQTAPSDDICLFVLRCQFEFAPVLLDCCT